MKNEAVDYLSNIFSYRPFNVLMEIFLNRYLLYLLEHRNKSPSRTEDRRSESRLGR